MKKSINKFAEKAVKNTKKVKGGAFGKGTTKAATQASSRPELL